MYKPQQQESLFNDLVKDHKPSIYRICRAYLYNTDEADDLYQEILYQIWKSLKNFKGQSQIGTWIYRIAVNTAISYNLKHKRNQHLPLPASLQLPYEETLTVKREQEAQLQQLYQAISQLPPEERLIISLVLEEKSYKEISEITGASISNTGVKINRIKSRLLQLINKINHG
ncbi:RNA polymerase sigma factor [Mucilaginibacter sp. KACC 22063]|uniref:RNA polymerase sigma factor n=1 Tax=Mucilaginibacter sp. KACC 22063 TaxID=3025666 RepID=UPI0023665CC5|nr:RNA polymerase sigma factor [Mucilaginibacter sp. KACC 22063]WDF56102.1 RNA polymerase sigma factor [Mucilaginibacter sp. KACC 22063]